MSHRTWSTSSLFQRKSRKTPLPGRNLIHDSSTDDNDSIEDTAEESRLLMPPVPPSSMHRPSMPSREPSPLSHSLSRAAFTDTMRNELDKFFFFARTEYSGENVLFLRLIECWKASWLLIPLDRRGSRGDADSQLRQIFAVAVEMYYNFIDTSTASNAPLNLEYGLADTPKTVLGDAAKTISTGPKPKHVPAAPFTCPDMGDYAAYQNFLDVWWDLVKPNEKSIDIADGPSSLKGHKAPPTTPNKATTMQDYQPRSSFENQPADIQDSVKRLFKMKLRVSNVAAIPKSFNEGIFNDIENHLYLTLFQQTFPRYVRWRNPQDNGDSKSVNTVGSAGTGSLLRWNFLKKLGRRF